MQKLLLLVTSFGFVRAKWGIRGPGINKLLDENRVR
jgi:hypothetical protein